MAHPYDDIPELAGLAAGGPLVRIPTQQDVPFTPRVRAVVDTAEFQRLRHITQLGLARYVYPGATHSRFEHALGVFRNALHFLRQLAKDPRFVAVVGPKQAELLMVSALLHDLGHWPFCHPIEDLGLPNISRHERVAAEFLAPGRGLAQVLRDEWGIDPADVLDVLVPKTDSPARRLLRSILSGPIDIDKLDYLERDSLHAGVPYGMNFDRNRLIQSLMLNEAGDGLAISDKGRTAAELMVFARYVMFSEVYWHHAVRSATCMFGRGFYELHGRIDREAFIQETEWEGIQRLRQAARGTAVESLLEGLFGPVRRLHKRVIEFSYSQSPELYRSIAGRPYAELLRIAGRLREELSATVGALGPTDLLIDAPPVHKEVEFRVDIYSAKGRRYRPFHEVSPVVEALVRTQFDDHVKRVRVFASAEHARALKQCPRLEEALASAARS